ncbi:MAG: glycosyltransferase family 1 protein [Gemmataceae bacterium]|nr:glycosyltransferase family 1 protein [Gemmataceae bacterium]
MKIALITSGAAGMFCGSCMKDNTLAAALNRLGHDALLIPTYTPIRTDEENVSQKRVFFGGINVYLQQKSWLFRHTPWLLDRLLDFPRLLRWVSRFAIRTKADQLGDLTVSMLLGDDGKQKKEVDKLVRWLSQEFRPDVVVLSNVLISGLVPALKEHWKGPVLATLQGDDIFLEGLQPQDRKRCMELIRKNGKSLAGYFATSTYYANFMAGYLDLPREQIHVVAPGISLKGHGGPRDFHEKPPYTIGYFARICPEKGFHHLVDAFRILRQTPGAPECRLHISGWLGENNRAYFDEQMAKLQEAGLGGDVEHVECPTHEAKVRFLQTLDVLSVPTVYREPKGIYVLEALANGVPVVQPRHGAFPELIEATGGGLLVEPENPTALARELSRLLQDVSLCKQLSERGQAAVHSQFTAEVMACATVEILAHYYAQQPFEAKPT